MSSSPFALDFDALEGGERFVTRGRTITESDIVQFAGLTGDMHPQHTDAAWAAAPNRRRTPATSTLASRFVSSTISTT